MKSIIKFIATPMLALACGSVLAATNVADLVINEGQGLGDLVYIGMTQTQANEVVTNGNCRLPARSCTFRPSENSGYVTLDFDSAELVKKITIGQALSIIKWKTSMGVEDGFTEQQVLDIYAGSSLVSTGYNTTEVQAPEYGYNYTIIKSCVYESCIFSYLHTIYAPEGGPVEPDCYNEVVGDISFQNPKDQPAIYLVDLRAKNESNVEVVRTQFMRRMTPNQTVSIDPAQYVDLEQAQAYQYTIVLREKRTVVDMSRGEFEVVKVCE